MPRRSRAEKIADARLLAEHHIVDVRYTRSGRRVNRVLHAGLGWISVEQYYGLQKVHDVLPIVEKVIEGGYRLKAALWNIDISFGVLATGSELPLGMAFVAGAMGLAAIDEAAGRRDLAILDLLALGLPFGELYLFARGAVIFGEAVQESVDRTVTNLEFFEGKKEEAVTRARLIDWRRVLWPFAFPFG